MGQKLDVTSLPSDCEIENIIDQAWKSAILLAISVGIPVPNIYDKSHYETLLKSNSTASTPDMSETFETSPEGIK